MTSRRGFALTSALTLILGGPLLACGRKDSDGPAGKPGVAPPATPTTTTSPGAPPSAPAPRPIEELLGAFAPLPAVMAADPAQLTGWARQANAILYLEGGNLVDPDGGSLLACGADGMPLGRVPLRADAVARAAAVREALQDKGITVAASLPPSRVVGEVLTQPVREAGLRILALALVADFSQSVLAGAPIDPARMWQAYPRAMTGFTPEEDRLFRTWDRDAAYQLSWRSEAADILLWATARAPLDFPRAQRDPRETFGTIFTGTEDEFVAATTLRPVHELLAEQERARGLLWAIQQAELAGGPPVRGVDGGVVLERLIALTWLLDWRVDWDDVDTSS